MQPNRTKALQATSTLSDLTACVFRTEGKKSPPLVGCSVTLIDDCVYLFGGRLVSSRTMVSSLYRLDLRTMEWSLLKLEGPQPTARYFHTAEAYKGKLVVFGGETYSDTEYNLAALNDVCIYDIQTGLWSFPQVAGTAPAARYAHLCLLDPVAETMSIMGGQDVANLYVHSVAVLDLRKMSWTLNAEWKKHVGAYRSAVLQPDMAYVPGFSGGLSHSAPFTADAMDQAGQNSNQPTQDAGSRRARTPSYPFFLFSNHNFASVHRELDIITSLPDAQSISTNVVGPLPPGLRFPAGTVVGRHLIVYGTFLSASANCFAVWALDVGADENNGERDVRDVAARAAAGASFRWTRLDVGTVLNEGSWNRALRWRNTIVILGDRERDIASDYDHRRTNSAHVALIDLESFGIYAPPEAVLQPTAQRLGLAALRIPGLSDFTLQCADARLACTRSVLESRWPWFARELAAFRDRSSGVLSVQARRQEPAGAPSLDSHTSGATDDDLSEGARAVAALRMTPRVLDVPERATVVLAFLEYIYTRSLCTPHQLSPAVLPALLLFSETYNERHLKSLCVHALHTALEDNFGAASAPERHISPIVIYEVATLSRCFGLQMHALRRLMVQAGATTAPVDDRPTQPPLHSLST